MVKAEDNKQSSGFPAQLRKLLELGPKYSCQHCETTFELKEFKPNGKKSRTWAVGLSSWGTKEPRACEVFVIKCPTCQNPAQLIIISKAEPLGVVSTPSPKVASSPSSPAKETAQAPKAQDKEPKF